MRTKKSGNQEARKYMMLNDPLQNVIVKTAIPGIIAMLISSVYSLMDTYFVSFLGTYATAAVSVNTTVDSLIMMAGSTLAAGASSYISRLLGSQKDEEANRVLSVAFFLAFGFGLLISVLGLSFIVPLVRFLGATPTCEQYSIDYATYVLLAAPIMAASYVLNQCLRSEGNATLAMLGMAIGGIVNVVLDPIFIMPWGLDLGVAGASLATAISKLLSFIILISPYLFRSTLVQISIRFFKCSWDLIKNILSIGSSFLFRTGFSIVSTILLNNVAGQFSDAVLAGIGVTNKVMMFPFSIILGFSQALQPIAGFNWGAKKYSRVIEAYKTSSKIALIGGSMLAVLLALFAEPFILLFAKADEEMLRIGVLCIRLQCIALPVHSWEACLNMLCAGLGRAMDALILATARQGTCFLPIVHLCAILAGADGLAAVQAVADILSLLWAVPVLRRTMRMINSAIHENEEQAAGDGGIHYTESNI